MSLVAYTYAKALKESFKKEEKEKFFSFLKELRELNKVLDLLEIKAFFISPVISVQEKKELLEKVFPLFMPNRSEMDRPQASIPLGKKLTETTEGKPDQHTSRELLCSFLFLLLDKKRWGELNVILSCLTDMENQMKGLLLAEVESVEPLSPHLQKSLVKILEAFFHKKIFLKEKKTSQKRIGGLRIYAQGQVFDDTLLFHLTQMENQIRRNFHDYTSE